MARRSFAIPFTALIAGSIGLAAGIYLAPTEEANEFRDLVQNGIGAVKGIISPETPTSVSPPIEAPQAKDSEETKRPPEAAEPISPPDSRSGADATPSHPPAERVGAEPMPPTNTKPTAPVTPEAISEPKPPAAPVSSAKPRAKKPKPKSAPETRPKRSHKDGPDIPTPSAPEMNPF
jgi:hypothetical protein